MKKTNVNAPINSARTTAARLLIALGLTGVMAVPAVAASVGKTATQSVQARNGQTQTPQIRTNQAQQSQRQPGQNAPELKVSYYTADPAKGGKIITTLTLTRPARLQAQTGNQRTVPAPGTTQARNRSQAQGNQAQGSQAQGNQPRPVNPIKAQAPAGARFAVIQGGRGGERVIDLSRADQMGGPGMGGPGGRDGGPRGSGPDQKGQNDQGSPPPN